MYSLPHIFVRTYGSIHVKDMDPCSFSGSGGGNSGPPKKDAPVKPKKKKK